MRTWKEKATTKTRQSFSTMYIVYLFYSVWDIEENLRDKVVTVFTVDGKRITDIKQAQDIAKKFVEGDVGRRANIYEERLILRTGSDPTTDAERQDIQKKVYG